MPMCLVYFCQSTCILFIKLDGSKWYDAEMRFGVDKKAMVATQMQEK